MKQTTSPSWTVRLLSVLLFTLSPCHLVTLSSARAEEEKPLIFCAVPASMPRIGKTPDGQPEGLDAALAKRLGHRLGRKVEFHWCGSSACSRNCLREGRCDVILGQPHEAGPPRDLAWSVPYARSQFGLVVPREVKDVRSLADLRGNRIGVVAGTVALSEKNHTVVSFKTREELLTGFRSGALDAAFVDADFAAWYLHTRPKLQLRLVKEYVPRERWNVALMVRAKDAALLVKLNRALSQLAESGALRDIHAEYGVPFRPPFTDSARRTARVDTWRRIRDRGEMVAAVDPANLPYSSAKGDRPGFDVEIARALAREMGIKLRIEWLDVHRETAVGKLLQRECDLALGAAVDPNAVEDEEELAGKVIYSRPYYGTGYLLVQRKKGPHVQSLADIKGEKSRRLGAEAGSVADYRLRQRGYLRRLYRNQLAVLKSLNDGDIDYAYLWANVGWTLHTSPDFALEIAKEYVPEDHWNIAVALRHGDDELKKHVDAALEKLVKDGTVSRILKRYHVPYYPPFTEEKKDEAGVIHHQRIDRGQEPQLARVQRSKHSYRGLERVRSAGELVVGLDQNNLPFSTAHPKPAGLDYEIAGLLAKQMGLSLRVYWAYSAHDSYPSKLATKKKCDVILGVMPDDRFAKRVLYSKPYHIASYQLVVRAGDDSPAGLKQLGDEPLAVEDGVAVRGLEGRKIRSYPSLEAALQAVRDKQAKAGYVISTRGPWLADKRWPKELKFIPVADSMDRVPLCVAVRKSDGDLKVEIDRALAELARSGRLAKVFARWHVPYTPPNE
ncbi:MAG TPA: transporter substrate-binding domain-containing protein [Gemmataceae bacterium]|nr:transporter substrate-binding domain-containing protein [Gemmataceae bacterium]